ncbi:MAG: transcription-repair coupling factor [Gemmataceae bacterium]|nr:transcription-repair coupling factor [Gemmataceae bacterium]
MRKAPAPTRSEPVATLADLTRLVQRAEGFHPVVAALQNGRSGSIDGAWGSSTALVTSALGLQVPRTLLVAIAHPRDIDRWGNDIHSFAGVRPALFPAWDGVPGENGIVDEVAGQRLRILRQLEGPAPPRFVLATFQALMQPVPDRAQLVSQRRQVRAGTSLEPDELAVWLVDHGFRRTDAVELPGEFSRRGGILDVYSPDAEAPYRLEFFGDELESIRQFSPQTQRSLGQMEFTDLTGTAVLSAQPARKADAAVRGHLCDFLPPGGSWAVLVEPNDLLEQGKHYLERVADRNSVFPVQETLSRLQRLPSVHVSGLPSSTVETTCHLRIESVERFSGNLAKLREELNTAAAGDRVLIACHNDAECKRLGQVLLTENAPSSDREAHIELVIGHVGAGFRMVDTGVVVLGDHELFQREDSRTVEPRRRIESRAIDSFLDLAEGDLVVHVSHGIARYRGMEMLDKHGHAEEHLSLEFRDGVRVYVPASKIDLVQKYVGGSKTDPELSKLGGTSWQSRKDRVQAAVFDLASEMVQLQAMRESRPGIACPPDSDWQREFEGAFPYQETPDQLSTLIEIKRDMERARPMDRLICGDVGYGKTELAIRAAFKTIDNGRQVAVLVPTTVLAEQHFRTFSQRMAEYPFVVDGISRFRSAGEQRRIIERVNQGGVDVIIGTHRLVSTDVKFKELGLVIIDEEQRFGVEHKERLKALRQTVDVLTLTATPIPRTLHLSLLGIRDISSLETPPPDRLAIETRIARFDSQMIRHAIVRELNREGQIYFVHNRVHNIQAVADRLRSIVPEARVTIAHGQMGEGELEAAMLQFVRRDSDILVATTIIESGLDIPNANTIFINQADTYGLADLHQLRGRVGRYKHRAYAYLLLDPERGVTPTAGRRLKAIEEFTALGAGFKIALRDLEIRGAGNILGTQQSGHIAAVGYEMYCQLLENAVRQLKNQAPRQPLEVNLDLPWTAYLPHDYVTGQRQRIEVYRRLARVRRMDRLQDFRQELRDRYGKVPEPTEWMLRLAELRLLATRWQVTNIRLETQAGDAAVDVVLTYRNPRHIKKVADRSDGRLRIVDAQSAYLRVAPTEAEPAALYACLKVLLRLPA